MTIGCKLIGTASCAVGAGLLYLEYKIVLGIGALGTWVAGIIGALGTWVAGIIGATGDAQTGIQILIYLPLISAVVIPLALAAGTFVFAIEMFNE